MAAENGQAAASDKGEVKKESSHCDRREEFVASEGLTTAGARGGGAMGGGGGAKFYVRDPVRGLPAALRRSSGRPALPRPPPGLP